MANTNNALGKFMMNDGIDKVNSENSNNTTSFNEEVRNGKGDSSFVAKVKNHKELHSQLQERLQSSHSNGSKNLFRRSFGSTSNKGPDIVDSENYASDNANHVGEQAQRTEKSKDRSNEENPLPTANMKESKSFAFGLKNYTLDGEVIIGKFSCDQLVLNSKHSPNGHQNFKFRIFFHASLNPLMLNSKDIKKDSFQQVTEITKFCSTGYFVATLLFA